MLLKSDFDNTAFVKFKSNNNFKQILMKLWCTMYSTNKSALRGEVQRVYITSHENIN